MTTGNGLDNCLFPASCIVMGSLSRRYGYPHKRLIVGALLTNLLRYRDNHVIVGQKPYRAFWGSHELQTDFFGTGGAGVLRRGVGTRYWQCGQQRGYIGCQHHEQCHGWNSRNRWYGRHSRGRWCGWWHSRYRRWCWHRPGRWCRDRWFGYRWYARGPWCGRGRHWHRSWSWR